MIRIEERRIKTYMKLSARKKLEFLLEYKMFVKKLTPKEQQKRLLFLKQKNRDYLSAPPSITSSE